MIHGRSQLPATLSPTLDSSSSMGRSSVARLGSCKPSPLQKLHEGVVPLTRFHRTELSTRNTLPSGAVSNPQLKVPPCFPCILSPTDSVVKSGSTFSGSSSLRGSRQNRSEGRGRLGWLPSCSVDSRSGRFRRVLERSNLCYWGAC